MSDYFWMDLVSFQNIFTSFLRIDTYLHCIIVFVLADYFLLFFYLVVVLFSEEKKVVDKN